MVSQKDAMLLWRWTQWDKTQHTFLQTALLEIIPQTERKKQIKITDLQEIQVKSTPMML